MKVSLPWLQKYFDAPLPATEVIADALTFHAFEIEEYTKDMLDVKVLPDRAGYALSHRGIACEISAVLNIPLTEDPLRTPLPTFPSTPDLAVTLMDPACDRYMGALVEGVTVGPSPAWLREALESVGQRSINNVVDATNYVMLNTGQPLHAFDASRLTKKDGYAIAVRTARENETITTLSGDEFTLPAETLVIVDAHADAPVGIAGIKGGKAAEITEATTDIIIESAHFDGTRVRRASQALKLFTDASLRYQNKPSPELTAYGMRDVLALITDIAGGTIVGVTDVYAPGEAPAPVSVSRTKINNVLGSSLSLSQIEDALTRLAFTYTLTDETVTVEPPFERKDIAIPEDLIEEVGRICGYDVIPATPLPPFDGVVDQRRFNGIERMKDQLVEQGFTEVSTQSFSKKGDILLANPLDKTMPALRTSLEDNLTNAKERALHNAPRLVGPQGVLNLFEVGKVFPESGEYLELRMTERVEAWGDAAGVVDNLTIAKLDEYGKDYVPVRYELSPYTAFSIYPFITRDIAVWTPENIEARALEETIRSVAGPLLVRLDLFDQFSKDGRTSYAFRLVFESQDKTLTDEELVPVMEQVAQALVSTHGCEVR
jgi:phenylalanyl-tRNA synthetase beta chain